MLVFDWAQTFYVDSSAVQSATEIALTRIDLYFRAKPPETNNKSGIFKPGVELKIVPVSANIPVINQVGAVRPTEPVEHGAKFSFYSGGQTARVEYDDIQASTNATVPTTFLFQSPIFVPTNAEYAVIIKFDGAENFVLWSITPGDSLLGSGTPATGPSAGFKGTLYQFISDPNQQNALAGTNYAYSNSVIDPSLVSNATFLNSGNTNPVEISDTAFLQANWLPMLGKSLKLDIYAARYFVNGQSVQVLDDYGGNLVMTSTNDRVVIAAPNTSVVSNNLIRLTAPVQTTEYVLYDLKNTTKDALHFGEVYYQIGPSYPNDKNPLSVSCSNVTITANGAHLFPNGSSFASVGGFYNILAPQNAVILKTATGQYIRGVEQIISNTEILVLNPFPDTFTATLALAPVAFLNELANTTVFGERRNLVTLYNSLANSSVRFVGNSIANSTIVNSGTGYSNNDYISIIGYEDINYSVKGNYAAFANITTDASGNITAVHFSNAGAGFHNSSFLQGANVNIYQSSGGVPSNTASAGSGANITFTVGSTIRSAMSNTRFANCEIVNFEVNRMKPEIWVNNPLGTSFTIFHRTLYHSMPDANTSTGRAYYVDTPAESANTDTVSKIYKAHNLHIPDVGKTPVLTSRSNEFAIRYANGAVNTQNTWGQPFSNTAVFLFNISTNNDFQAVWFDPEIMLSHYSRYIINEEYTNEHTNYGAAVAKHCGTKINLQKGRFSEDVVVYLDAYRPANTDFKVYARIKNSSDEDAFDDLEWTLLEQVDGIGLYSSLADDSDYKELTYNLPAYPNTDFTLDGTVTIRHGNASIVGVGTHFGPNVTISAGGTGYTNGDIISFTAPTGFTDDALDGIFAYKASVNATGTVGTNTTGGITSVTLVDVGKGWANQVPVTNFTVAHANGAVSAGSGGTISFKPGLQSRDLIKIYSPYTDWANVNYTTAVVNTVVSNTVLEIVRTYGEIGVQISGTVSINTTSTTLTGTGTTFQVDFTEGDLIAIWANSSAYEVHEVVTIVSNTNITMEAPGTFANTSTFAATVIPDTFMNNSLTVSNLLVDRIAYPHQAFNNAGNDNVSRYYNSSMIQFDGFDTMQLKVVLLSTSDYIVPKVDDVRGVLVSA